MPVSRAFSSAANRVGLEAQVKTQGGLVANKRFQVVNGKVFRPVSRDHQGATTVALGDPILAKSLRPGQLLVPGPLKRCHTRDPFHRLNTAVLGQNMGDKNCEFVPINVLAGVEKRNNGFGNFQCRVQTSAQGGQTGRGCLLERRFITVVLKAGGGGPDYPGECQPRRNRQGQNPRTADAVWCSSHCNPGTAIV